MTPRGRLLSHLTNLAETGEQSVTELVASWYNNALVHQIAYARDCEDNETWQVNMTALSTLHQELVDVSKDLRLENKFSEADLAKMMSDGVTCDDVTDKFNTLLVINGKICGNPDDDALLSGKLPVSKDSLIFLTSFSLPLVGRSAVQIEVGYLKNEKDQDDNPDDPVIVVLGHINLALKNARSHEPDWKKLSPEEAAKALRVDECSPMWKLTLTGRPTMSLENVRSLNKTTQARQGEFSRLRKLFRNKKDVKMSIITPQYKVDVLDLVRPFVDEAWSRDGGEPLQPFLEGSKYKHVVNLGTIAPPDKAPYQKPVPPVIAFTDSKQYAVTMACGNQSEYHCQQDQIRDLERATGMTAIFLADPGYVVKECNTPRVFLFWLRVPQSQISLEPKAGQSGYIILPRIKKLKHDLRDEELAVGRFSDTDLVVNEILGALNKAAELDYTGSQANNFLMDRLSAMHSKEKGSSDVDELLAEIVEIGRNEDYDDEMTTSKLKQLVDKTEWLKPPTTPEHSLPSESEPVRMSFRRIEGVSSLMPSDMACYRAQVPVDMATGTKRYPIKLDLPDLTRDANGNLLRGPNFVNAMRSHRGTPVEIHIEDSDKTYKMEMNAISRLAYPLIFNEHDRPSEDMHTLFSQLIRNDFQDGAPTATLIPIWNDIVNGHPHIHRKIAKKYQSLSKDKKQAFVEMLGDSKFFKVLVGPPGTGKTTLSVFWALTSLLTARAKNTAGQEPVAGSMLSEAQMDRQLDALAGGQGSSSMPESVNNKGKGKAAEIVSTIDARPRANFQVLYVLDMNTSVNDVVEIMQDMAREMGLLKIAGKPINIIRLHSVRAEIRDVPKKYVKLVNDLQRDDTEFNGLGGAVLEIIVPMMRKVEEMHQHGRAERRVSASLTEATRREFQENRDQYPSLSHLIERVAMNPEIWADNKANIFAEVKKGPLTKVLRTAHILAATPVGAGDFFLRQHFKPDLIIQDEAARSKEVSSLILLAAHSPAAYILVGDTQGNGPYVKSLYQHYSTSHKSTFTTVSTFGRDHEQVRQEKAALAAKSSDTISEHEETDSGVSTVVDEDEIPVSDPVPRTRNPNTFGPQLKQSLLARLERGGSVHVCYLRQNFRHKGMGGQLVNTLWYDKEIQFRNYNATMNEDYQAAKSIMARCGKESEPMLVPVINEEGDEPKMEPVIVEPTFEGNSIIVDMRSKESAHGFSYRNDAHIAYARQKMIDCLGSQPIIQRKSGKVILHKIKGIILYVCPYTAQLEAVKWAMQEFGKWVFTSWGELVEVDFERLQFRTHMGAQGFQASIVIVDYVRSAAPGHSGDPQINNVMLSRASFGQILLLNNSVLERVNQHAPANVTLKNVFRWHRKNNAVVESLNYKDMVVCNRCCKLGHTAKSCPMSKDPSWKCHGCGKPHHPCDCRLLSRMDANLPSEPTRPPYQASQPPVPAKDNDPTKIEPASVRMYPLNARHGKPNEYLVVAHDGTNHYEAVASELPAAFAPSQPKSSLPPVNKMPAHSASSPAETLEPETASLDSTSSADDDEQEEVNESAEAQPTDVNEDEASPPKPETAGMDDTSPDNDKEQQVNESSEAQPTDASEDDSTSSKSETAGPNDASSPDDDKKEQVNESSEAQFSDLDQGGEPSDAKEESWDELSAGGGESFMSFSGDW